MKHLKDIYLQLQIRCLDIVAKLFWWLCRHTASSISSDIVPAYVAIKHLSTTIEDDDEQNDALILVMHKDMDVLFKQGFFVYNVNTIQDLNYLVSIVNDFYRTRMTMSGKIPNITHKRHLH